MDSVRTDTDIDESAIHTHTSYKKVKLTSTVQTKETTSSDEEEINSEYRGQLFPRIPKSGDLAENYVLLEKMSAGSGASVFLACDVRQNDPGFSDCKEVALKVGSAPLEAPFSDPREVVALKKAGAHENIVKLLAVCKFRRDDTPYSFKHCGLAFELINGPTLRELLMRHGVLSERKAVRISTHVCRGLMHMHSRGVAHCNLEPSNVVLDRAVHPDRPYDGVAKLVGFSRAFTWDIEWPMSQKSQIVHGPGDYIAPEALDERSHDPAHADVYSLGMLMYWMVSSRTIAYTDTLFRGRLWKYMSRDFRQLVKMCLAPCDTRLRTREALRMLETMNSSDSLNSCGSSITEYLRNLDCDVVDRVHPGDDYL